MIHVRAHRIEAHVIQLPKPKSTSRQRCLPLYSLPKIVRKSFEE